MMRIEFNSKVREKGNTGFGKVWRLFAALVLASVPAAGQGPNPVVQARALLAADGVRPGGTLKAAVAAKIASGYHINDNKPALDYLIPTELKLEPVKQVEIAKLIYPKGELKKFQFSDTRLSVYEGTVAVGALLKVARTARPGTYTLKGKFAYQACNDHACLPPTSVPVELAVKVVRRGTPVKRVNADVIDGINFE